jgi:tRNA uridine 5-carboxymethylaminomethyl modification enzyme
LAKEDRLIRMEQKFSQSEAMVNFFKDTSLKPEEANPILEAKGSAPMSQPDKMFKVFSRPQLDLEDFRKFKKVAAYIDEYNLDQEVVEQAEIQVKYSGYIEKEKNNADKLTRLEDMIIPDNFNFDNIQSISIEAKQKLNKIRPRTIAQASRISGVSPSDISVLLIYMGR